MTFADPSPWLAVFGRAHPVLLHAPLGILPAVALLEFGAALLRKPVPRGAILTLAWLTALTGAAAAASGFVLGGEHQGSSELLGQHKLLGIALASLCLAAAVAACFGNRLPFRVLLLAALAVMVPAGHLGGSMTHGRDFLFAPLRETGPAVPSRPDQLPPTPGSAPAGDFARTIRPLLERTCTGCHNPDKQKGELLLTTVEGLQKGGENGAVLVPGKPDESPLLQRCLLPIDHDDHMPPDGKPQPTAEELAALRAWIAAGAPF